MLRARGIRPLPPAPYVSPELYDLGQMLAFDKILSGNRDISCMTCHSPTLGSDDDRHLPIGTGGTGLGVDRQHGTGVDSPRSAPPLFNLHALHTLFWDGRVSFDPDLGLQTPAGSQITPEMEQVLRYGVVAAQAMLPVTSRTEMRGQEGENELADFADDDYTGIWDGLMARLGAIPEYVDMFELAYPGTQFEDMSFAHAANAIAGFELAAFHYVNSPFDRFLTGKEQKLSPGALAGLEKFLTTGCVKCHSGRMFTDQSFHDTGLAQFGPGEGNGEDGHDDYGRINISGDPADKYAFRTAPLRNVELTGPWGHVGQYVDLTDFVNHYIDAEEALLEYDVSQIDPELQPTLQDNYDAVLDNLDPMLVGSPAETDADQERAEREMALIVEFLLSLTDPAARDQSGVIPFEVPSGLPVDG